MNAFIKSKKVLLPAILLITFVIVLVLVILPNGTDGSKGEMERIKTALSEHVLLPVDETPTLATVINSDELQDAFLRQYAKTGDKVLVFPSAKQVYLYRPSVDRLVSMGPLTLSASVAQVDGSRIVVRTGDGNQNRTKALVAQLAKQYPKATVKDGGTANRQDYPATIAIDLTDDTKYDFTNEIAKAINGQRGILPQGEQRSDDADILIITGIK